MTVHLLYEGFTLCGFGQGMFPGEWPGGHKWTWLHDAENATCPKCLKAIRNGTAEQGCDEKDGKNRPGCG